jgi:hypothetical protein
MGRILGDVQRRLLLGTALPRKGAPWPERTAGREVEEGRRGALIGVRRSEPSLSTRGIEPSSPSV